jgi:DNA polymerase III alpha subunit (gram-positive type)
MFLACDTETGGLNPKLHSLLTFHGRVLDDNLNLVDEVSIAVKHPVYHVTASALAVNKIDLVKHDQLAVPVEMAKQVLHNFVMTHGSGEKLMFMAHNAPFDKGFLDEQLDFASLGKFVDYHMLDTVVLGVVEKLLGTMPKGQSLSLAKIADTLGLKKGEPHTAHGDVTTMVNYLRDFVERYKAMMRRSHAPVAEETAQAPQPAVRSVSNGEIVNKVLRGERLPAPQFGKLMGYIHQAYLDEFKRDPIKVNGIDHFSTREEIEFVVKFVTSWVEQYDDKLLQGGR